MTRRTSSPAAQADRDFAFRVKVRVPFDGFGSRIDELTQWLNAEVGPGNWQRGQAPAWGGSASAFHFRDWRDMAMFCEVFDDLDWANR